jgi:MFS family permease
VMFLVGSGLFAMFFFNSLYIQRVLHYGPLKAGLAFLPFTAGIMLSAGITSAYGPKIGVRLVSITGIVIASAGLLLLTRIPVDGSYVSSVLPSLLLTSFGMGGVFVSLTLVATTGLADEDQGLASGLFNTSQQVGGALGLAILSTIAASHTSSDTPAQLVRGFHWAFAGSAALVLAGAVALLVMLRKRDVARIEEAAREGGAVVGVAA